jgi:hypothetical protein
MSSKGGGNNRPQEVTQTSTNLPEYAEPYFRRALERTAYETMRPYESFPGQRIAEFAPQEQVAMQGMTGMAAAGSPYQMGQASDIASGIGYQPMGGTIADPETLQTYMDPYQQLVTDIEKREATRQSGMMGSQIGQQAAQAGGLGGYREAIMQSERERNLGQQLGDIQSRGGQQAFSQAQRAFEADRAARMGIGSQRLQAAQMLGGLGSQQQQMGYERLRNLQAAGEIQRQQQQQGLTMGYQDFLRQQAYPREQISFYNQILRGLPIQPGTTQATFGGPSSMERLLGSGIAGVGLYRGLRGGV